MTKKRKRIMRQFRFNEISAVDRPAQADARVRIMKRDDLPEDLDLPDDYEIEYVPDKLPIQSYREDQDMISKRNEEHLAKCLAAAQRKPEDIYKQDFGDLTNRDFDDALDSLVRKNKRPDESYHQCYVRLLREDRDAEALAVASTHAANRVAPHAR